MKEEEKNQRPFDEESNPSLQMSFKKKSFLFPTQSCLAESETSRKERKRTVGLDSFLR